jgi:uncharacterized protein YidB (DUF937 family)
MVRTHGGLGGLLERLERGGLGEQVKSWVSPDAQNARISGEELTDAVGREHMDELAGEAGVSPREAADSLAKVLPGAVDALTPEGRVPERHHGLDLDQITPQLAKLLGGNR